MLKEKHTVVFNKTDQEQLNELWPLWRSLKAQKKYFEADQIKHKISILERRVKHGRG